jgi:hypothetical protein
MSGGHLRATFNNVQRMVLHLEAKIAMRGGQVKPGDCTNGHTCPFVQGVACYMTMGRSDSHSDSLRMLAF